MSELPSVPEPPGLISSEPLLAESAPLSFGPRTDVAGVPRYSGRFIGKWLRRAAPIIVLSALLFLALRNAPLRDIWASLQGLRPWQIVILLVIDLIIYGLMSARWWFVAHAQERRIDYLPLIGVRLLRICSQLPYAWSTDWRPAAAGVLSATKIRTVVHSGRGLRCDG